MKHDPVESCRRQARPSRRCGGRLDTARCVHGFSTTKAGSESPHGNSCGSAAGRDSRDGQARIAEPRKPGWMVCVVVGMAGDHPLRHLVCGMGMGRLRRLVVGQSRHGHHPWVSRHRAAEAATDHWTDGDAARPIPVNDAWTATAQGCPTCAATGRRAQDTESGSHRGLPLSGFPAL